MASGRGKAVGPDLSSIGRQATLVEIEEAVNDPGARIRTGYALATAIVGMAAFIEKRSAEWKGR